MRETASRCQIRDHLRSDRSPCMHAGLRRHPTVRQWPPWILGYVGSRHAVARGENVSGASCTVSCRRSRHASTLLLIYRNKTDRACCQYCRAPINLHALFRLSRTHLALQYSLRSAGEHGGAHSPPRYLISGAPVLLSCR